MLSKLHIDNYALIDKSMIDFSDGFTVITGETGAGKSIMLDALSLLTGARADTKAIGNKERKMIVEAFFPNPGPEIKKICEENEIDWDEKELILRREISTSGKSRGFVNDTPTNLSVMNSLGEKLIDIHSQHKNSLLNQPQEQLSIIDAFGDTKSLLESYQETFRKYVILRNQIKQIKENISKGKENKEFIMFRLEQLDKLKPRRGELQSLERESEILGDAERIKTELKESFINLGGTGTSAIKLIQNASVLIDNLDLELIDPKNENDLSGRLNSIKIELKDISDTLEEYSEKIHSDPERLEKIESRIHSINEAMRHFKVKDENELVDLHESLKEELLAISDNKNNISALDGKLKELAKVLKEKAEKLTESRLKNAEKFGFTIEEKIKPLGLPNIRFKVEVQKGKMSSDGQDTVIFYCRFNKNHAMQPISEIASGGEISRVMLGIKAVMANKMNLPTIIFDEIDTGVSGEIAHKMGSLMKEISKDHQVLAVTHLPQVAVNGKEHLKVYKNDEKDKTVSHIKKLGKEERVKEIAGMLSGTSINDIAIENAKMLLKSSNNDF